MNKDTSSSTKAEKTNTKATESKAGAEPKSAESKESSGGEGAKAGKQPPRPVSFFSSVRTDEYRSGWDSVFGKPAKRAKPGHFEVSLSYGELSARERKLLLAAFRRKALSNDIDPDRLTNSTSVDGRFVCRFEA